MIKGVVFDLDHTLFDRYATLRAIMPSFCEHFDVAVSVEKAQELICKADKQFVYFGWNKILKYLTEQGMFGSAPDYISYSDFIHDKFAEIAVPYEFTYTVINSLRDMGLNLGIITNGDVPLQTAKINLLSFEDKFDEILISGEIGIEKPKKEPFIILSERIGLSPSEMVYVGDNPLNDVEGSRNAGYTPVYVNTTEWWAFPEIEKPRHMIENISFLPEIIRELL